MKRFCFTLYATLIFTGLFAQQSTNFRSPLDIPLILSGNFGELRGNHFHSGIDIKTQGVGGHKVRSVESGYVSRIKIQEGGYGKALYIAHPNGYTSVYGHLSTYNAEISDFIKKQQYAKESYSIDIYLQPNQLPVEKGEIIALSGNTGSSSGPHLHFELRTSKDQFPQNVLLHGFPVKDDIPPRIKKIAIYPLGENAVVSRLHEPKILDAIISGNEYGIIKDAAIPVWGKIGFGLEVYDYLNGANNRCGIFSLELRVNGKRHFYSEMDQFSFSNSRYINAHIDYKLKAEEGIKIQRLYRLPHNKLHIYKQLENDGTILIQDTLEHIITIRTIDTYGNRADATFRIKGKNERDLAVTNETRNGRLLEYSDSFEYNDLGISLSMPAYSFYEDMHFFYDRSKGSKDLLSDVYHIGDKTIPLHKAYELNLDFSSPADIAAEKLCLVSIDDGEIRYAGGDYNNGVMRASLRYFGDFGISADSTAPLIIPKNISAGADMQHKSRISFSVSDNLSGISSYKGYIDKQWVLFEYDPKNEHLFYEFDEKVKKNQKIHELELYLEDAKGNKAVYHTTFFR